MVRREQNRLKRIFKRVLLASLVAPGAVEACSSSSGSGGKATTDGGAQADGFVAETGTDATMVRADSGTLADSAMAGETGPCQPSGPRYDDASYAFYPPDSSTLAPCYYFVDFPCGVPNSGTSGCYLYLKDCVNICNLDGGFIDCRYWQDAGCDDGAITAVEGGPATIACGVCNGVGRRPAGLRVSSAPRAGRGLRGSGALGGYFAEAAHLEAASVVAFERLHGELRAHGAPSELVAMAARSALDEVRHARVTSRLARRFGSEPAGVRVRRPRRRSLAAIAVENAVEGCVRETFGALLATWQAANACDPGVRTAMKRIAADETRHAALAWAIDVWMTEKLGHAARARVQRSRQAAIRSLLKDIDVELPAEARLLAGLPDRRRARALASALFREPA